MVGDVWFISEGCVAIENVLHFLPGIDCGECAPVPSEKTAALEDTRSNTQRLEISLVHF